MPDSVRQELGLDASQTLSALAQLDAAFEKFGMALRGAGNQIGALNQAGERLDAGLKKSANVAREVAQIFEQTRTPQEQHIAQMGKLNAMLHSGAINQDTFGRASLQAGKALEDAGKSARGFMVSWETLARVVATQAIVRTMSMIRDGIAEAYQSFLKFSNQISEIHAIDPSRSFGQVAQSIREMSDAFNQPLSRVAEGQYQTLSNQFTSTADVMSIMTAANALAKVTAQDLSDAVLLLTGALNAYGESADNAGLRAAQFDKTIELGRLRMGELGTAMGRIQTSGHALGVSMEELQAALVSTTIGGLKASEAATQIRGVFTALMKPTKEMTDAFHQLGVETPEAAVATWGLQGVLAKLKETAGGTAMEMAKLFPNFRGLGGALRMTSEGAAKVTETLLALQKVNLDTLSKKLKDFISTDAERLTAELNKVKNFFTAEFGAEIVRAFAKVADVIGGGAVPTLRAFTSELGTLVAAAGGLAIVASGFAAVKLQALLATDAIAGTRAGIGLLIGLPIAETLGKMIGSKLFELASAKMNAVQTLADQEMRMHKEQADAKIHESERANHVVIQGLRQLVAAKMAFYLQDTENLKASVKITEQVTKQAFDSIMQSWKSETANLGKIAEGARKKLSEIPDQINEIQTGMADRKFEQGISRFDPAWKAREYAEQANRVADEAARKLGSAKDANQQKLADAEWKRAEAFGRQAAELFKQQGSQSGLIRGNEVLNELDNKRINALHEQEKTQERLAKDAESRGRQAEKRGFALEEARKELENLLDTTTKDAEGSPVKKTREQLGADLLQYQEGVKVFEESLRKWSGEAFTKSFSGDTRAFDEMRRQAEREFAGMNIQQIKAAPEAIAAMHGQLQTAFDTMRFEIPVLARMEKQTGQNIADNGPSAVLDSWEKMANEIDARDARRVKALADLESKQKQFQEASAAFWKESSGDAFSESELGRFGSTDVGDARQAIADAVKDMGRLSQSTKLTDADMKRLEQDVAAVGNKLSKALPGVENMMDRARIAKETEKMSDALKEMKKSQTDVGENAPRAGEPSKAEIDAVKRMIEFNRLNAEEVIKGKMAVTDTTMAINAQLGSIQQDIAATGQLATGWWNVATAARAAARASAAAAAAGGDFSGDSGGGGDFSGDSGDFGGDSGGGGDFAMGGLIRHFDRGGHARGTDTIPAMLSPGEFVMNAGASRRFYSQLMSMNTGHQPAYRALGGPVTNAGIVGDVTVNVGSGSKNTGREVIHAINREIRRGTGRLYS